MIDGHVHLDKGPLTKEYVLEFVDEAIKNNINEIHILNHSHRFKEFSVLYEKCKVVKEQVDWFNRDFKDSIYDYIRLIDEVKKLDLPVKILFGLEVCYFSDREDMIKDLLKVYDWDFLIGSIHFINNIAYDCRWSVKELWEKNNVDELYRTYYESTKNLIKSNLFTQIGHIDTIKMFGYYPSYDLKDTYKEIAVLLNEHNMLAENNTKVNYEYGHHDIGLSKELLEILKEYNCKIVSSSDAHQPDNVGKLFDKIYFNIC